MGGAKSKAKNCSLTSFIYLFLNPKTDYICIFSHRIFEIEYLLFLYYELFIMPGQKMEMQIIPISSNN